MENQEKPSPVAVIGPPPRLLAAILDTIMPASEDGAMPSAQEMDFPSYLRDQRTDFLAVLQGIVDHFDDDFPDLPLSERVPLMSAGGVSEVVEI